MLDHELLSLALDLRRNGGVLASDARNLGDRRLRDLFHLSPACGLNDLTMIV